MVTWTTYNTRVSLQNEFQPAEEVVVEAPEVKAVASENANVKEEKEAPRVAEAKSEPIEAVKAETNGVQKDVVSVEHLRNTFLIVVDLVFIFRLMLPMQLYRHVM